MMNAAAMTALGAFTFAAAGYLGASLGMHAADRITPFPDAPPSANPPIPWIVSGCALVGAAIFAHPAAPLQIALLTIVCVALAAVFVTDARCGIVPDIFTLGPLAAALLLAFGRRDWWIVLSVAVPLCPFVVAALVSRGRAMGWGDVKLVALGGAVLGAQLSILAFSAACFAAAAINYRRGRTSGVIAFAPYLATAIGVAIPVVMWQ